MGIWLMMTVIMIADACYNADIFTEPVEFVVLDAWGVYLCRI